MVWCVLFGKVWCVWFGLFGIVEYIVLTSNYGLNWSNSLVQVGVGGSWPEVWKWLYRFSVGGGVLEFIIGLIRRTRI